MHVVCQGKSSVGNQAGLRPLLDTGSMCVGKAQEVMWGCHPASDAVGAHYGSGCIHTYLNPLLGLEFPHD